MEPNIFKFSNYTYINTFIYIDYEAIRYWKARYYRIYLAYALWQYTIFNPQHFFNNPIKVASKENSSESAVKSVNLFDPALSQRIFIEYGLTNRECHVASKLLENASNKEIAAQLYISEATIKKHIQNIYQKFGATDRSSYKEIYIKEASAVVHTIS